LLWIAGVAAVGPGLLVGLGFARDAQATRAPSAAQLLHTALVDAAARGSGHQAVSSGSGSKTSTFSDDVATNEGRQVITLSDGARARILVVGGVAYFSGNQTALVQLFGLPAAVARDVGKRWVSVPSSNSKYSAVAADTTLPATLAAITPSGALTATASTRLHGEAAVAIRGRAPAPQSQPGFETMYVTDSSRPLPLLVTFNLQASGRLVAGTETIALTDWGEHLALAPPTNTIPVSKI